MKTLSFLDNISQEKMSNIDKSSIVLPLRVSIELILIGYAGGSYS